MARIAEGNEGARLLAATGLDHAAIAAQLGVSRAAVTQWLGGTKRPSTARRKTIEALFGVPAPAWDVEVRSTALGMAQAQSAGGVLDAEGRLRAQLRRLDEIRGAAVDDSAMPPQTRLRLEATETRCIELLSKLTGEGQEISEARILRTPAWRRLQDAIVAALQPFPAAAVAVSRALKELAG